MRCDFALQEGRLVENSGSSFLSVFENPDQNETDYLLHHLKIPEQTLHSSLQPESLARVDLDVSHLAVILKVPQTLFSSDSFSLRVSSIGLFLFESGLVIVTGEHVSPWLRALKSRHLSPATLLIHAVSWIIERFSECMAEINARYDDLEDQIDRSSGNIYLKKLFMLEKSLIYYLNAINNNTFALERLRSMAKRFGCTLDELAFLDTVITENQQSQKQAEVYSNLLSGLVSARLSIVSNNLSALMKTLNLVTIGIMVPTFIVSVFSMNVAIPLQGNRNAFIIVMILATTSALGFAVLWRMASTRISR